MKTIKQKKQNPKTRCFHTIKVIFCPVTGVLIASYFGVLVHPSFLGSSASFLAPGFTKICVLIDLKNS
jgi:ABC-type Co2+ transport system permease subunit